MGAIEQLPNAIGFADQRSRLLMLELEFAMTFVDVARTTCIPESEAKNLQSAWQPTAPSARWLPTALIARPKTGQGSTGCQIRSGGLCSAGWTESADSSTAGARLPMIKRQLGYMKVRFKGLVKNIAKS